MKLKGKITHRVQCIKLACHSIEKYLCFQLMPYIFI